MNGKWEKNVELFTLPEGRKELINLLYKMWSKTVTLQGLIPICNWEVVLRDYVNVAEIKLHLTLKYLVSPTCITHSITPQLSPDVSTAGVHSHGPINNLSSWFLSPWAHQWKNTETLQTCLRCGHKWSRWLDFRKVSVWFFSSPKYKLKSLRECGIW